MLGKHEENMMRFAILISLSVLAGAQSARAQGGATYYCTSGTNGATISVTGSTGFAAGGGSGDLVLHADSVLPNNTGLFYYGVNTASVPFGLGTRCVGGQTRRVFPIIQTAPGQTSVSHALDYQIPSAPSVTIAPGSTFHFQYWFRSGGTFDLTNAVTIDFVAPLPTPITTLLAGGQSGHPLGQVPSGGQVLVTDQATWDTQWAQHSSIFIPTPPAPVVDFTQDIVVMHYMGWRPTGGYSTVITDADLSISTLGLAITSTSPGANCAVTFAITHPYHFATVPRVAGMTLGAIAQTDVVFNCP